MFRHPNLKHNNGTFDDFSFQEKVDQSIRYFKVPAVKEKEDALNLLLSKISTDKSTQSNGAKIRRIYFTVGSVAAAACVILFFMHSFFMVESYRGTDQTASNVVFLPDDSRVVLADGAQIKFSKLFNQRSVQLQGSAYFEVEKGSDFYVKTKYGGVLVIGTRFSVSDIDNTFEVHCYDGIVGVDYKQEKVKISKGMHFTGLNAAFDIFENEDVGYPTYAFFDYECHNQKLDDFWPVVENYFGVDIVRDVQPKETFTGQFRTGNVQEVIEIVCTSMKMEYEVINEDQIKIELK